MDQVGTLLTIAELSVAIAGFAGIVSVLGRGRSKKATSTDAFRLETMLENSLMTALFALGPLPFLSSGVGTPELWRGASAFHLGLSILIIWLVTRRFYAIAPEPDPLWISVVLSVSGATAVLVDAWNVFGFAPNEEFSLFLAALIAGLGAAGLKFMLVCMSLLSFTEETSA